MKIKKKKYIYKLCFLKNTELCFIDKRSRSIIVNQMELKLK